MKAQEIEIYDINKVKGGYEVEYSTESGDATKVVDTDDLITYITDNELNAIEFIDWKAVTSECDGVDVKYLDPYTFLEDNYYSVISQYIESL